MPLGDLAASSLGLLKDQCRQNRVVLIHPQSRTHLPLLAALLGDFPCRVYYHQMRGTDARLADFLSSLVSELAGQSPAFGYRLTPALREAPEDRETLVRAFLEDLADLAPDDLLLVLDDFDCCDAISETQAFFERALADLPDHCHLLIRSRTIPRLPWLALIARRQAVVIHDDVIATTIGY